jgi:assimilatory nitrate reductase catalytic subunit
MLTQNNNKREEGESHSARLGRKLKATFRSFDGPLTQDLVQVPGDFGLGNVPAGVKPDDVTSMVCGFCSVGCSLNVHLKKAQGVNITPNRRYPVNLGMACPKGWEALSPLAAPDRATTPLLKLADGSFNSVDWDTAMQVFALRFKAIQDKFGPESVAWIGTGQITTEELAFLGALGKFGMGIVHGDSNTRQCMATSAVAYKQSFGFDAPPYTYKDFEESDVLVFIGSNLCITHPILWQRVLRNKNRPEIIVVDPRKTETAMVSTQHYALQPKSDLTLLYGLAHILLENGWIDERYIEQHTNGFAGFKTHLKKFPPGLVAKESGLSVEQLHHFAKTIHEGKRVSFWWTMGVNQSHEATRTAQAIINLALMTGNMGRPGTGANSVTGQCNAMGSRLFSNTSTLLGGRDFLNGRHRQEVADILGLEDGLIPKQNSWAYDQIVDGISSGKIKGLWIIGTNSSHSWINQSKFRETLRHLDFLVVQDMYHTTETAQQAHLILPAAGWGEKDGTFINSERRFGLLKKISRSPGEALSDFKIFKLIAHYWGCSHLFKDWTSPEAVFHILKKLSKGQPCDFSGIADYRMLDEQGGVQWPWPENSELDESSHDSKPEARNQKLSSERRLFEDGRYFHADGKAKFLFDPPRSMPEPPDAEYPFLLLTGRGTSSQWHTGTRTEKSAVLRQLCPKEIYVEVNPQDGRQLKIVNGQKVTIASRRGAIEAAVVLTPTVQRGQIFIPMHYEATNQLTLAVFDPHSRQPAYKACAVAVKRKA